jgi:hypothetical protein
VFMLYAIPVGLIAGLVLGGRLGALGGVQLRFAPAFVLALVVQVGLFSTPLAGAGWVRSVGPPLYVATLALILAALLANLRARGVWLVLVGATSNFAAIAANGGAMPVLADALRQHGGEAAVLDLAQGRGPFTNVALMGGHTRLPFLGDIFALPGALPFSNVYSAGDVLIGIGVAVWIVELMRPATPRTEPKATESPVSMPTGHPR